MKYEERGDHQFLDIRQHKIPDVCEPSSLRIRS